MPLLFALVVLTVSARADVNVHADQCRAVLGEIPGFRCADGKPLAITVENVEQTKTPKHCDKPTVAQGDSGCYVGARLGRIRRGNVDWVFLCRKSLGEGWGPIAYLGANRLTGETCFFDSNGNRNGAMPPPGGLGIHDVEGRKESARVWTDIRGESCVGCHSNKPYLVTPLLGQQVLGDPEGTDEIPATPLAKRIVPGAYYRVIGVKMESPRAIAPRDPETGEEDRTCTQCHLITPGFYTSTLVQYATGAKNMALGEKALTPWAKRFPQSHWMPLGHGAPSEEEWNVRYGAAVQRLRYCADNDDEKRCLPSRAVFPPEKKPQSPTTW